MSDGGWIYQKKLLITGFSEDFFQNASVFIINYPFVTVLSPIDAVSLPSWKRNAHHVPFVMVISSPPAVFIIALKL